MQYSYHFPTAGFVVTGPASTTAFLPKSKRRHRSVAEASSVYVAGPTSESPTATGDAADNAKGGYSGLVRDPIRSDVTNSRNTPPITNTRMGGRAVRRSVTARP